MATTEESQATLFKTALPWFGVRRFARKLAVENHELQAVLGTKSSQLDRLIGMSRELIAEVKDLHSQREIANQQLKELGAFSVAQLELRQRALDSEITEQANRLEREKVEGILALEEVKQQVKEARQSIVETDEIALLQEAGVYQYRHPLTDAVAYQKRLAEIETKTKAMVKKDGGAVLAITGWEVNGSAAEGRKMVRDFSKLMLRAFNAEADNLVRGLKPYKLDGALDRLKKVAEAIERLGKTMHIRISPEYYQLRVQELEVTADFVQKQAEEKEVERCEKERLREERKAQQEIERERERLEKEHQHYANALGALEENGDEEGAARLRAQLSDVKKELESVDFRAANIRAGYVYVISNVGSFGDRVIKIGMTRRLDPLDRIRELSDASVPFNFDVHALFFSKDAVAIETEMHTRLSDARVNTVNRRREFFRATPSEVRRHLAELAGELLEFQETPEAIEYRQCIQEQRSQLSA